jgi:hypothetical protein
MKSVRRIRNLVVRGKIEEEVEDRLPNLLGRGVKRRLIKEGRGKI